MWVSCDALDSWPREAFAYEERQTEVLGQVSDRMNHMSRFGTARFDIGLFK